MDVVLALFPWFIIWKMAMTKREKVGVAIAMSMGVMYELPSSMNLYDSFYERTLLTVSAVPVSHHSSRL
jgi:hypothetical protein